MQNVALLIKAACTFTPQLTNFPLAEKLDPILRSHGTV